MKMAIIEWVDSHFNSGGWMDKDADFSLCTCVSAGIISNEDKEKIRLSLSFNPRTGHICDCMDIPKCAIKRIRRLKVK